MPKTFDKVLSFQVQGEICDKGDISPESIINNYTWTQKDVEGEIHIVGRHKDKRGRITKMTRLPKKHLDKEPDTELFLA